MTAASELTFSRLATADSPVQDTALSIPPENSCNVAGNLNYLKILSNKTRPEVAISVAQQEPLYQAQVQRALRNARLEQAHSQSGSGV